MYHIFLENTFSSYRSQIRAKPKPPSRGVNSRDKLLLNKNSFDFGSFKQINWRTAPLNLNNIIDDSCNILCNNIVLYCRFFKGIYLKNTFLTLANYVKFGLFHFRFLGSSMSSRVCFPDSSDLYPVWFQGLSVCMWWGISQPGTD